MSSPAQVNIHQTTRITKEYHRGGSTYWTVLRIYNREAFDDEAVNPVFEICLFSNGSHDIHIEELNAPILADGDAAEPPLDPIPDDDEIPF